VNPKIETQQTSASMSFARSPLYIIKKSKVSIDLVKFPDYNPLYDPGFGLFQNFDGSKKIKFLCTRGTITTIRRDTIKVGDRQHMYGVDSAIEDGMIVVPTNQSIFNRDVAPAFRVQHNKDNPTHKLMWVLDDKGRDYPHSYPQLIPLYPLKKGDEVTFDYNLS
jgi:hypothetical protein